ncbi:MarR family winged helix-turn-helix transcriptional regulator [Paraglaciecola chathamensis]|uniref:MarR family winged helix-turn-helix transcriptional regulator n=1 Tax=Paraglaciecola chathamensis TaxID=368405 RepID=UPI00068B474F|nr:MarR family winged helix-turn-helix transcriptional regulator [Paraglaciecola agarilytica]
MRFKELFFKFFQCYRLNIRSAIDTREMGLKDIHVRCLFLIASTPDCTATIIVKKMDRDIVQVACLIQEILEKGWIENQGERGDKDNQVLILSKSGSLIQQQINTLEQNLENLILSGLYATGCD